MQFYQKEASGKVNWQRRPLVSSWHRFRDLIVFLLPVRRLPRFLIKLLYGVVPEFVFFIHPRRTEDIYVAFPPAVILRRLLGRKLFIKVISLFTPTVLSTIKTPSGINGVVVTSPLLSENFFSKRTKSVREAMKGLLFSAKLLPPGGVFGLGALWPMITRRGAVLQKAAASRNITVTNGHCGTLISLYLSINKVAETANMDLGKLKIAILGVGKMGENLARLLYGKVASITLIDINEMRLENVEKRLQEVMSNTDIQRYNNRNDIGEIRQVLEKNHIVVCTTSNVRRILKPDDIPDNCIIIDDSRPEAIMRDLTGNRIVIEGGLLKIPGLENDYDFGLGIDENVFGCLAECYLLASKYSTDILPTLGNVDLNNFYKMVSACENLHVEVGDFKCRNAYITDQRIDDSIATKKDLSATVPFKNICWIFKIDGLIK